MNDNGTPHDTNDRKISALDDAMRNYRRDDAGHACPDSLDDEFATLLARAALLPDLPRDDYDSDDEYVDAHIDSVVGHSGVRLRFPVSGDGPVQSSVRRSTRLSVVVPNGKMTVTVGSLLAALPRAPRLVLVRTSDDRFTIYLRPGALDVWADHEPAALWRAAVHLLKALAEDVVRRLEDPCQSPWSPSLAVVADASQDHLGEQAHQWWIGSVAQDDFIRLLRVGHDLDGPCTAEDLGQPDMGPLLGRHAYAFGDCQGALAAPWIFTPQLCALPSMATWSGSLHADQDGDRDPGCLIRFRTWMSRTGNRLVHRVQMPIEQANLRRRLPVPPPVRTEANVEASPPEYHVLLDRELAEPELAGAR